MELSLSDILYLNVNNKPSYMGGLYQNNSINALEIPNNSIYMLAAYETIYPYSDKFISIVRDNSGQYYLINHNLFVDIKNKNFNIEKTNFIYQDIEPVITLKDWINVVKNYKIKDKKRFNIYIKLFEKEKNWKFLFPKNPKKISYNEAFQLYRFLEICSTNEFNLFIKKYKYDLIKHNNHNWAKWNNELITITHKFSVYQTKLIYTNLTKNLNYYKLKSKLNINILNILIGKIDANYAGINGIEYCHPNKYIDFWKDYNRFKNKNIVSLKKNESPHMFKLPETSFTLFNKNILSNFENKYLDKNGKPSNKPFFIERNFNKIYSNFIPFMNSVKKNKVTTKVIIIGCNNNGNQYANNIKMYHNKKK